MLLILRTIRYFLLYRSVYDVLRIKPVIRVLLEYLTLAQTFHHDYELSDCNQFKFKKNFLFRFSINEKRSIYFNQQFYLKNYPEIKVSDLLLHYCVIGHLEGRWPCQLFDTDWYRKNNRDIEHRSNPLVHFIKYGLLESRRPICHLDVSWYESSYSNDLLNSAFEDYSSNWLSKNRRPNPLFDSQFYYDKYKFDLHLYGNSLAHFIRHGVYYNHWPSNCCDTDAIRNKLFPSRSSIDVLTELNFDDNACEFWFESRYKIPDVMKSYLTLNRNCFYSLDAQSLFHAIEELYIYDEAKPIVSIIIPVFNKVIYTLRCIYSILLFGSKYKFEIIVVDDASTDSTSNFASIKHIKYLRNSINSGFIKSCNNGSYMASGDYLCFLNNDTVVTDGWLDELVEVITADNRIGLVGSKLVFPDGILQEAGGHIWNDCTPANTGKYESAEYFMYNYTRSVMYISGASILTKKEVFVNLGGFSEEYLPAYFEDTDYCMRLLSSGLLVKYVPTSEVIHYEGVSSGRSTECGVKSYQVNNAKRFKEKWECHCRIFPSKQYTPKQSIDLMRTNRLLFVDDFVPTPDKDAGSYIAFNTLLILQSMGYDITFVPTHGFGYSQRYNKLLNRIGIETIYGIDQEEFHDYLKQNSNCFEICFVARPENCRKYLSEIKMHNTEIKFVYETCDMHHLRLSRMAALNLDIKLLRNAEEVKFVEYAAMEYCDATIIRSSVEMQMLSNLSFHHKLHYFPLVTVCNKIDYPKWNERSGIAFIGGFNHNPNIDAVLYFSNEILPLIHSVKPDINFYVIGQNPPEAIRRLESKNIKVLGYVEDLVEILATVHATVVPLRYGAGVKGKIGASMAAGVPTVSTQIGIEGMGLTDGTNVLVGPDETRFAQNVLKLITDEETWKLIHENSISFADENWGSKTAVQSLNKVIESLGLEPPIKITQCKLHSI